MKYDDEELQNALSAEYVLGTLDGKSRSRYERMIIDSMILRRNMWQWEKKLNGLGESLHEVDPDEKVWKEVEQRLRFRDKNVVEGPWKSEVENDKKKEEQNKEKTKEHENSTDIYSDSAVNVSDQIKTQEQKTSGNKTNEPWWKTNLAASFILAASILSAALLLPQPQILNHGFEQLAVVQGRNSETLWFIEIHEDTLKIRSTNKVERHNIQDYELWIVAVDGRAPISLGLLPKRGVEKLPRPAVFDQIEIAALAVSLEPLGGSPSGAPTLVLYTTELVSI